MIHRSFKKLQNIVFKKLQGTIAIVWLVLRFIFVYVLEIGNIICNIFLAIMYLWLFHPNGKTLKCKKIGREWNVKQ